MKRSSKQFIVAYIVIAGGLWIGSQWWERGLAESFDEPDISPNGCYRVESFKPFWVLPNTFHPRYHPDDLDNPQWFPWWGYPGFYRLFDNRSGKLLGQSRIYDLESASGRLNWGNRVVREVSAGMITIGPNAPDCIGDQPTQPKPEK